MVYFTRAGAAVSVFLLWACGDIKVASVPLPDASGGCPVEFRCGAEGRLEKCSGGTFTLLDDCEAKQQVCQLTNGGAAAECVPAVTGDDVVGPGDGSDGEPDAEGGGDVIDAPDVSGTDEVVDEDTEAPDADGSDVVVLLPDGSACASGPDCASGRCWVVAGSATCLAACDELPCNQGTCVTDFVGASACVPGPLEGACVGLLGATAPCSVTNGAGTCTGQRVCDDGGWSACSAAVPAVESCNGEDDDCDGTPDDVVGLGEPCAGGQGDCAASGELECDVGAGNLYCSTGGKPAGEGCDDGDACTTDDACTGGPSSTCVGGANPCVPTCTECDGAGGCAVKDGFCLIGGICYASGDPNPVNGCERCEPNVSAEAFAAAPDDTGCSDGDACTTEDECAEGECKGTPQTCDDGNVCTHDFCEAGACTSSPTTGPCSDGNFCTVEDVCSGGSCSGTARDCSAFDAACGIGSCSEDLGACVTLPATPGSPCDDDQVCTEGDRCVGFSCVGDPVPSCCTTPDDCGDGNPCTEEQCDTETGECSYSTDGTGPCTDGLYCTVDDACDSGVCQGVPRSCDALTDACSDGRCAEDAKACVKSPVADELPCPDDGKPCTTDTCGGGTCQHLSRTGACDDGNPCTASTCMGTVCTPQPVVCEDHDPCTIDSCGANGCSHTPAPAGAPCGTHATCNDAGACVASACGPCLANEVCIDGSCAAPGTCLGGWCPIRAGTFTMGNTGGACADPVELPAHSVTLTRAFAMKRTEVTNAEWQALMGTSPSSSPTCSTCPVDQVSFYDVLEYLNRLSARHGHTACYSLKVCTGTPGQGMTCSWDVPVDLDCDGFRLPTEAEWEYAARAGTTGASYAAAASGCAATADMDAIAWYAGNAGGTSQPVGMRGPNPWGLQDILGNVMEMTFDDRVDYTTVSRVDPLAPHTQYGLPRTPRGGRFQTPVERMHVSYRGDWGLGGPLAPEKGIGFRPVRTVPICGDGHCNGDERCTSCVMDCGAPGQWTQAGTFIDYTLGLETAWYTPEGLQIYFERLVSGQSNDLFVATRASTDEPFGTPLPVTVAATKEYIERAPVLSPNGLELFLAVASINTAGYGVAVTTRASASDSFTSAPVVFEKFPLGAGQLSQPESISSDGLELYITSSKPTTTAGYNIWRTSRTALDAPWSAGEPIAELNTASHDSNPMISPSGTELYFFRYADGSSPQLHVSHRAAPAGPWGAPIILSGFTAPLGQQGRGSLSSDGLELALPFKGVGIYRYTRTCEDATFATIPPGSFTMGDPTPYETNLKETVHPVTLTRAFQLQTTEVTQAQWRAVTGNNPSEAQTCGDDCPVERINWWDAVAYLNGLSLQAGLPRCYDLLGCTGSPGVLGHSCSGVSFAGLDCTGYRLPTEAEWEYAVRAGTTTDTWLGDEVLVGCNVPSPVFDLVAWSCHNSGNAPKPVASLLMNPWGLFDMLGNVWEWTHDWAVVALDGAPATDPTGPASGTQRVVRGGSFLEGGYTRAAARSSGGPTEDRGPHNGLRAARTIPK